MGAAGSGGFCAAPCAFDANGNFHVHLRGGAPSAPAFAVVGFGTAAIPFGGGLIWPTVSPVLLSSATDSCGHAVVGIALPAGVTGSFLAAQWLILDGGGTLGFSISNALEFTVVDP